MNKTHLYFFTCLILTLSFGLSTAAQNKKDTKLKSVPSVDLKRYAGLWYEIAKYPNRFQKQCVGNTSATYTLKQNGRIEVKNECLKEDGQRKVAIGEAKVVDKKTNSRLKVRFAPSALSFIPFVWGDYWIIDLDPEYTYAIIGEPKRDYFWILSRKPTMPDNIYKEMLRRAEAMGFDAAKVERTNQNAGVSVPLK